MNQKAFTLLEVLVTIILLVTGSVTIINLFGVGLAADVSSEKREKAVYVAQEKMEEVREASLYSIIDSFASARANLGGDFADFDREVIVAGDPKQVNVVVYWDVKGDEQRVDLVSLFANYDY